MVIGNVRQQVMKK